MPLPCAPAASNSNCPTKLVVLAALTDSTLSGTAGSRLAYHRWWLWLLVVVAFHLPTGSRSQVLHQLRQLKQEGDQVKLLSAVTIDSESKSLPAFWP
jgi:hypothetical protein